jgi:hypothetical protein
LIGIHHFGGLQVPACRPPAGRATQAGSPRPLVDAPTIQEKLHVEWRGEFATLLLITPSAAKQLRTDFSYQLSLFLNFVLPASTESF